MGWLVVLKAHSDGAQQQRQVPTGFFHSEASEYGPKFPLDGSPCPSFLVLPSGLHQHISGVVCSS